MAMLYVNDLGGEAHLAVEGDIEPAHRRMPSRG